MTESELHKELGRLTREKEKWEGKIPYTASLLTHASGKIRAKALWLLGEMGLAHPAQVRDAVPGIAAFCLDPDPLLRARAAQALGRIGRGSFPVIEVYFPGLFPLASDPDPSVRLGFLWACENIAVNTPGIFRDRMPVFAALLRDPDDRVRMEAPEIFRVLGKRRPEFVSPYLDSLRRTAETDTNRVVRIHCLGAIRAAESMRKD